jgi:hypothetical protein
MAHQSNDQARRRVFLSSRRSGAGVHGRSRKSERKQRRQYDRTRDVSKES